MIVCMDVGYRVVSGQISAGGDQDKKGARETAIAAAVGFEDWRAKKAIAEVAVEVSDVEDYVSGKFYKRELPCLVASIDAVRAAAGGRAINCLIVDGNVRLDDQGSPGLGMYLFNHFNGSIPVVGVAKKSFHGLTAVEVVRGESSRPLYVTAVGMDETEAANAIKEMAGSHRMPTMLKRADRLSRTGMAK